jgi:hypothetical protein
MSSEFKKLTSKNPADFEPIAQGVINTPNIELFKELVENEDFLFDFVKQNVSSRLAKYCNGSNYTNLVEFLKYYSPSYEEFIVSTLAKFADEDLTDRMLDLFENGTVDEKIYCAKFFSYIKDPLAIDILNKYAFNENSNLSGNCASTLAVLEDRTSYEKAVEMLESNDDFEILSAVKFLVSYGDKTVVDKIISAMKKSSFAENIAGEILYLSDIFEIYNKNSTDGLYIINTIINGLGEILGLSQVFDFKLYEFLETLIKQQKNSQTAVVLLNAQDKFETLTENDEYLFDETKDTKQEIKDIKELLKTIDIGELYSLSDMEIKPDSLFVYTALDFTESDEKVRSLLSCDNPTLVLKSLEVLKQMETLTKEDKSAALGKINDENIKSIINAI